MSRDVERVIETLQHLSPHEREEVLEWLEERRAAGRTEVLAAEAERQVLEALLSKGMLEEIVEPMTDEEDDDFEPIEIEGEPLSEMIIRERR